MGNLIFWLATGYVWCGIGVAAVMLAFGLERIDPAARGAYGFRPLIAPGVTLLWPLVLWIWLARAGSAKED